MRHTCTEHLCALVTSGSIHRVITFAAKDSLGFWPKRLVNQTGLAFVAHETALMPVTLLEWQILFTGQIWGKMANQLKLSLAGWGGIFNDKPLSSLQLASGIPRRHGRIVARNTWHNMASHHGPHTWRTPATGHSAYSWNVPCANSVIILSETLSTVLA